MSISVSSQRVATANLFANGSKDEIDAIRQIKTKRLLELEKKIDGLFDYYMPEFIRDFLGSRGVPSSVHSFMAHSHPVSKTIENYFLYRLVPNLMGKQNLVISCKEAKVGRAFMSGDPEKMDYTVYNRLIHAKDKFRYLNPHRDLDISYLTGAVKEIGISDTIFIHDEVHYWSLCEFQGFLGNMKSGSRLLYTIIYPAEIHAGYSNSVLPEAYRFIRSETDFTWFPDGQSDGAYWQPINPWLLTTSRTEDRLGRSWTITKMNSVGAHHLFSCVQGGLVTESEYEYSDSSVIDPANILKGRTVLPELCLRGRFIRPVVLYLMALKKPDAQSAVAKLRMLSHGDENMGEALFVAQLAKQIKATDLYDGMGNFDACSAIKHCLCAVFGDYISYVALNKEFNNKRLVHFIMDCKDVRFSIRRNYRAYEAPKEGRLSERISGWDGEDQKEWDLLDNYHEKLDEVACAFKYGSEVLRVDERRNSCIIMVELARRERAAEEPKEVSLNNKFICASIGRLGHRARLFLIRLTPFEYMESAALELPKNLEEALEQGDISSELYEQARFRGPERERGEDPSPKSTTRGDRITCGCGGDLKITKVDDGVVKPLADLKTTEKLGSLAAGFYSEHSKSLKYSSGALSSQGWTEALGECRRACGLEDDFDHCLILKLESNRSAQFGKPDEATYLPGSRTVFLNPEGESKVTLTCPGGKTLELVLKPGDALYLPAHHLEAHKCSICKVAGKGMILSFRNKIKELELKCNDSGSEYSEDMGDEENDLRLLTTHKNSLCALEVLAKHRKQSVEVFVSLLAGSGRHLLKEIQRGGLTLPTLVNVLMNEEMQAQLKGPRGGLAVQGKTRTLGLEIVDGHVQASEATRDTFSLEQSFLLSNTISRCDFSVSYQKAKVLSDSLIDGFTGKISTRFQSGKVSQSDENRPVSFLACFGFAGSGKSYWVQTVLKCRKPKDVLVVSPRRALKDDWVKKIGGGVAVKTYERALSYDGLVNCLVIDEIGLYAPGFVDLAVLVHKPSLVVLLGDPLQCEYHNKKDRVKLEPITENIFKRCKGVGTYLGFSHRLADDNPLFDLPCYGPKENGDLVFNKPNDGPWICAARETKEKQTDGYTVSETQGLSFNKVNVLVDRDWLMKDDGDVIVAFTRARGEVNIQVSNKVRADVQQKANSEMLKDLVDGRRVSRAAITNAVKEYLPDAEIMFDEPRLADSDTFEDRLVGDPYLKSLLSLMDQVEEDEVELEEVHAREEVKTHLPLSCFNNESEPFELAAKEYREASTSHGRTEQIDEMGYKGQDEFPATHKALYLRHESEDTATFFMSVKKRLRFRNPEKNRRLYNRVHESGLGKQMFDVLKQVYGWRSIDSLPALERGDANFLEKRMAKSAQLIEKHSYRSDPDWPSNYLKVFLKQQTCTKLEKRGINAKAGQTIACFCHSVLCRFGPVLRQTEMKLKELLPENVMVYSQKNYSDLDEWCKTYVNGMLGTDSDYEAFDRSQDEKILDLEVAILEFFLWPEALIQEYVELKLMMGCGLGNLAVMRFSGEFGTFFFNTMCNMVFSCMRYKLTSRTAICFAGDDMYAPGRLEERSDYNHILEELTLKAKVHVSYEPLFCGWRMSPYGIVKEPCLVLDRWKIAVGNGTIGECMVNYAIEASYGYRLSEYLYEVNIDLDAMQELVRLIVKVRKKLPPNIAKIFSEDPTTCKSDGEKDPFWGPDV
nr:replicase [Allamanda chlorotic virus B]